MAVGPDVIPEWAALLTRRVARLEVACGIHTDATLDDLPDDEAAALTGEPVRERQERLVRQQRGALEEPKHPGP